MVGWIVDLNGIILIPNVILEVLLRSIFAYHAILKEISLITWVSPLSFYIYMVAISKFGENIGEFWEQIQVWCSEGYEFMLKLKLMKAF